LAFQKSGFDMKISLPVVYLGGTETTDRVVKREYRNRKVKCPRTGYTISQP
jgi:hypothetical protein